MRPVAAVRSVAMMLVLVAAVPWELGGQQPPSFRTATSAVSVSVSVRRGNAPVTGLAATDFVLLDNGVPQRVAAVLNDALPLDVTLFMDTSGSTAGVLARMKQDLREIVGLLGPDDRFRLLTIGHSVYETLAWTRADAPIDLAEIFPVAGISLVYDAFYVAATHEVPAGRRHLVVALTDGRDLCSVVRPAQLRDLVGRTEAVIHWVPLEGPGGGTQGAAGCTSPIAADDDSKVLDDLVKGSGGQTHTGFLGRNVSPVKAFRQVLDEYRRSYVLYFTPEGVAQGGWHDLSVDVQGGRYAVRARTGYFGR